MDPRPTPEQSARLDRVIEVLAWLAWAICCWHLIGFTLRAFLG